MKSILVFASFVGALVLLTAMARASRIQEPAQSTAPKPVSVAVTTIAVRETSHTRTDVLLLWNRNERTTPIGHAIKACIKAGSGDILGGGLMSCSLTLSLPLGKLTAAGIVHSLARYTLVITGGTGVYEGTTGPLFVRREADGVRRLTFAI